MVWKLLVVLAASGVARAQRTTFYPSVGLGAQYETNLEYAGGREPSDRIDVGGLGHHDGAGDTDRLEPLALARARPERGGHDESVGIATGILITALHLSGLATLTHTPSPMKFLRTILGRPDSERPYLILVTGYPSCNASVPAIGRRSLEQIATFDRGSRTD